MFSSFKARLGAFFNAPAAVATKRGKQLGVSLIGVLLGLVVAGGATAVAVQQYLDSEAAASLQKNTSLITTMIGSTKSTYGAVAYSGLTTAAAINSRVIPSTLATNSTTAANEWGGAITLVDHSATTPGTSLLTWAAVSPAQCQSIVNSTHQLARRVQVGGTDVKPLDGAFNLGTLTTQCAAAAAIAWTIGRG